MPEPANFSRTPAPPYYAVVFSSQRTEGDHGYERMAAAMSALAAKRPGYLGHESARSADGFDITVSYWRDEESVGRWKRVAGHHVAQRLGNAGILIISCVSPRLSEPTRARKAGTR